MESDKIKEDLKKLENSPLFALSLGSKELFHSNFLYWLINAGVLGTKEDGKEITGRDLFCDIIQELSGIDINPHENWVARREKMNFDLSLWETEIKKISRKNPREEEIDTKCLLVIENKMKSVPSVKQIVEYIHKFKEDEVPRFILLTLMENFPDRKKIEEPTPEQLKEWEITKLDCKIVTYKDLVVKLKESIQGIKNWEHYYYEALISDYTKFVDILCQLADISKRSEKSSMMLNLDYDINHGFEKLRILQLVQAIRVGVLYTLIRKEFEKDKKYEKIKFNTGYGKNGGAFLEILYAPGTNRDPETGKELKDLDPPTHYSIGVQVQDHQYAHFICPLTKEEKKENPKQKFEKFFAKNNFNFQKEMQQYGFEKSKRNINKNLIFRSFGDFSFQVAEIPDQTDYKFIVNQIIKDIDFILDNFNEKDLILGNFKKI